MAVVRKKQDDKYLQALRELVTTGGGNRQCFDCAQKGPTYVNMTIGSFVCTRCSGVLRGLTPPHRVKSISMATFTQDEVDFLKAHGNDVCAKTWLGLWDPKRAVHQDHRELMIDKYERKRYYLEPASPLKSLTNAASLKTNATTTSTPNSNGNGNSKSSSGNSSNGNAHTTPLTNGYGGQSQSQNQSQNQNQNHNNHKQHSIDNSFHNIQLTPPTSQRTTANGLHKSSSSAISRPHHQQNGYNHHHDAFMVNNNGLNGLSSLNGLNSSIGSASTGALSDTSSCASNGFGPDADFVADFGTANIFDATSASSVGSPAVSSASSVASSNGYAKIQPIKAAQQFMNGHANSKLELNGTSSTNGNAENFADFDHAPIYNAAANYQFIRKNNAIKGNTVRAVQQQQQLRENRLLQQQELLQLSTKSIDTNNLLVNLKKTATEVAGNSGNHSKTDSANIIFSESTSNFNDPFDDYNPINSNFSTLAKSKPMNLFENDFDAHLRQHETQPQQQQLQQQQQQQQQQPQQQPKSVQKFTPLAMAAHATAMAVLESNYCFNSSNHNSSSNINTPQRNGCQNKQWDVWPDSNTTTTNTTLESPSPPAFGALPDNIWLTTDGSVSYRYAAANAYSPLNNDQSYYRDPHENPQPLTCSRAAPAAATPPHSTFQGAGADYQYQCQRPPTPAPSACSFPSSNPFLAHLHSANYDSCSNLNETENQNNLDSYSVPVGIFARNSSSVDEYSNSNSYCDSYRFPMPNGMRKNSTATSANVFTNNNNNNHKLGTTPAEDRYAALKDLDEQLRERKAVAAATASILASTTVDSYGNNNNNSSTVGSVNPFKHQQQPATLVNPFQGSHSNHNNNNNTTQNLFGQMTVIPNGMVTNGLAHQHQQQQPQAAAFFNYSNGFAGTTASTTSMFPPHPPPSAGGPNGCGFGIGAMQQQITATGGMGNSPFNNPFAATGALNSNNPFL